MCVLFYKCETHHKLKTSVVYVCVCVSASECKKRQEYLFVASQLETIYSISVKISSAKRKSIGGKKEKSDVDLSLLQQGPKHFFWWVALNFLFVCLGYFFRFSDALIA